MVQKRIVKRKPLAELDPRLTNIESKLQVIEDQIESKFQVIEGQIESKFKATIENNMNNFDRINSELEELKKNTKTVSRRKQKKTDVDNLVKTKNRTREDVGSHLTHLLQSPSIQSLPTKNNESRKKLNESSGLDLSQIGDLLQNPFIQSLLKKSLNIVTPLIKKQDRL
jgi:hypothetical protein